MVDEVMSGSVDELSVVSSIDEDGPAPSVAVFLLVKVANDDKQLRAVTFIRRSEK